MSEPRGTPVTECEEIDRQTVEMDPSGYWFLIRANFANGKIEVAACHKDASSTAFKYKEKNIKEIFSGRCAQDIYHKILIGTDYVKSFTHAAYLGKELKKAELALTIGINPHYQE